MAFLHREIWQSIVLREQQQISWPGHIHDDIELIYIVSGGGLGVCDGKTYTLQAGDFFLVYPNQIHYYADCVRGTYILLVIKPAQLRYQQDSFHNRYPVSSLYRSEDSTAANLMLLALQEHLQNSDEAVVLGLLTSLFGKLLPHYHTESHVLHKDSIPQILEYCSAHYLEDISIDDICRQFQVSRSRVSHTFSSRFGITFPDYINSLRLQDAQKLLQSREYTITEVARFSGFSTIRTFNRVFKDRVGCTPSEYLKRL